MKYHYIFPRNNVLYPQANFSKWMWQNDGRQKEQRACNYLISWLATGTRQQWSSQVRARQGLSSLNYMPALKHYRRKSTNWCPLTEDPLLTKSALQSQAHLKNTSKSRDWPTETENGLVRKAQLRYAQEACLSSPTITPSAMLWLD